jgi:hypothetical protein
MGGVMDFGEESENEFVFAVKAKSACSQQNISNVSSPLPGVSVKREKSVKFGDVLGREDGVLGGNVFREHGFEFLFLDLPFGHDRYF